MTKHQFKVGDIVRLKSGGPPMTVSSIGSVMSEDIGCQWFSGRKMESGYFPAASLVPGEADDDGKSN
jgi:uncharacterized protein YodC (DUF2158 family)